MPPPAPAPVERTPRQKAASLAPPAARPSRRPDTTPPAAAQAPATTVAIPGGTPLPAPPAHPPADRRIEGAQAQVTARLREAFAPHFHYPLLARRNGWEGEVRLGLRVEADGRLTHIRVVRSSGHRVLDHAAIRSLERTGRVRGLPAGLVPLLGRGLDVVLPVRYRLLGTPVSGPA